MLMLYLYLLIIVLITIYICKVFLQVLYDAEEVYNEYHHHHKSH